MLVDLVYNNICTKKYDIAMVRQGGVKYNGVKYGLARAMFCTAWSGNGVVQRCEVQQWFRVVTQCRAMVMHRFVWFSNGDVSRCLEM